MLFSIQTRLQGAGVVTVCGDDFFFKDIDPLISSVGMPNNILKLYLLSRINTLMRTSVIMMITGISEEYASYHKVKYQLIGFKAMEFLS